MKQVENKLIPEKGKFIATKDLSQVYESVIYLGIYDKASNYVEITENKRNEILAEQERKMQEELAKTEQTLGE